MLPFYFCEPTPDHSQKPETVTMVSTKRMKPSSSSPILIKIHMRPFSPKWCVNSSD